jgi:ferredoxin
MAYVITDACIKCMACSRICPVSCIHPADDEAGLDQVPQLYINPDECIVCGACANECPTSAIFPQEELPPEAARFTAVNAGYYKK